MAMTVDHALSERGWRLALVGILAVAAWARLCNLGTFSLALDEVFTMGRAVLPFKEMFAAAANDPENVPMYIYITGLSLRLGLAYPWLRLVPIAAGLASIPVWAIWTRRHLGSRVGLLVAGLFALSTFHVRYSQELRAYPYLFLISGLTMLAGDLVRRRPTAIWTAALAFLVALGCFTHHSYLLIFIPLTGFVLFARDGSGERPSQQRAVMGSLVVALILGTAPYVAWLLATADLLRQRLSRGANLWTPELVATRWQFLTVAAAEGEPMGWLAAILAVLAVIGVIAAIRHPIGRWVLIPAVVGIVANEAGLVALNRWSQGRYDLTLWPFVMMLVALGAVRVLGFLRSRHLRTGLLLALTIAMLASVERYHRTGRPHWDRMAEAIRTAQRPGEPVLAETHWSTQCTGYYLGPDVATLGRSPTALREALDDVPSALVVVPMRNRPPDLRKLTRRGSLIARIPQTGDLFRLRPDMIGPAGPPAIPTWPQPAAEFTPEILEQPVAGCVPGIGHSDPTTDRFGNRLSIDFSPSSRPALRSGWSDLKRHADGTPFAWVTSREAAVEVLRSETTEARLAIVLWPVRILAHDQRIRVIVNDDILGEAHLDAGIQRVVLDAPATCWRQGRNLVVLQFWNLTEPLPGPGDGRTIPGRAAGVQRIQVTPLTRPSHRVSSRGRRRVVGCWVFSGSGDAGVVALR